MNRRRLLTSITSAGAIGMAGCIGGDDSGNGDGNGGGNGGGSADSETQEAYDPDDYYGLPECDGERPIQLVSVSGETGMIRNTTSDDLLVLVKHDDTYTSEGPHCDAYPMAGGAQKGYAVNGGGEPSEIRIAAKPDYERHRDHVCKTITGGLGHYTKGCVDPDTFQG